MGKGVFIGVDGLARKVKNIYVGVNGVARKVKKAWIGVNGVARLFYSSGEIKKSTATVSDLRVAYTYSTTVNQNYAFFRSVVEDEESDGDMVYTVYLTVYNPSLTRSSPANVYNYDDRRGSCLASNPNYNAVHGGRRGSYQTYYDELDAYDSSLTQTRVTGYTNEGHQSGTLGNYMVFFGGSCTAGGTNVRTYDTSLTFGTATSLTGSRDKGIGVGNIGGRLILACGSYYKSSTTYKTNVVETFDASLTKTTLATFPEKTTLNGKPCGNDAYAIFAYGSWDGTSCATYAYNSSLTLTTVTNPQYTIYSAALAVTPEYAVICGGYKSTNRGLNRMEGYDTSLTRTTLTSLTTARQSPGAAVIGDYLLVGGGIIGDHENSNDETVVDYTATVEAYEIS